MDRPEDGSAAPGTPAALFEFFNEIGIVAQLSRVLLETRLPKGFLQPHFAVLGHLVRVADGRTPLELARAFQLPKTSMTHTLAGLEAAGLVEMRPNPQDGRSKRVFVTAAGRAFRDAAIAALGPDLARLAAEVDPARLAALVPELAAVRRVMDRQRDRRPGGGP